MVSYREWAKSQHVILAFSELLFTSVSKQGVAKTVRVQMFHQDIYFHAKSNLFAYEKDCMNEAHVWCKCLAHSGVSITLVISGHWRCNRRLWPLKWLRGPSLMKSKQTAVRNLTGGGRPPVTGFYWNPWHCSCKILGNWELWKWRVSSS